MIDWCLPLELKSPNVQEHWTKKHKRNKKNHRIFWYAYVCQNNKTPIKLPCKVTITRLYPRSMNDDNFISSCKFLRDEIADFIIPGLARGRADDDLTKIQWEYKQEKSPKKMIRIQVESTQSQE